MEPSEAQPADLQTVEDVFFAAKDLTADERERLIADRLNHDPSAQGEARRLLAAHDRNSRGFLESPLLGDGFNALDAAQPEPIPERIGPYHILGVLSEGDASLVYFGEHSGPVPQRVAIKVLRSRAERREVLRRFEQERRMVAQMDHPGIARFLEAGTTADGRAYFAMEYIDGVPVSSFAVAKSLNAPGVLALMVQVCLAVEHAHQRGVIHRDLKPSNILVTPDGHPKIIDFGIALVHASSERLTFDGQIIGTPAYISPEQLRGGAATDTRADVYALGVILYELLAGRLPFDFGSAPAANSVGIVLASTPHPLRAPGVSTDTRAVVSKAMHADPESRYGSVAEFRADLQRLLTGHPVHARKHHHFSLASKFVRRHWVATMMTLLALALIGGAAWRARDSDRQRITLAIGVAESLVRQSAEIAKKLGPRGQRRPLVEELERIAAELADQAPNDPRVMNLQAMVCSAVCDLEQQEGRLEQAAAAGESALQIRRRLANLDPRSPRAQMNLSIAIVRTGDIAHSLGDLAAAERAYARAHEIDLQLARAYPDDPRVISVLGWSYDRLGTFAKMRGDLAASTQLRALQLQTFETLFARESGVDACRALSETHTHLGHLGNQQGDMAGWHRHANIAVHYARLAVERAPTDRLAVGNLILTESGRWDAMFTATGALPTREEVERVIEVARNASAADPWDPHAAHHVRTALLAAVKVAKRWGDAAAAAEYASGLDPGLTPTQHPAEPSSPTGPR
ncbi:MAG: protein kinase [Phycisphaeraceae bacterium]|nr:protein kinase [Phycisphaeraceae bacterium]